MGLSKSRRLGIESLEQKRLLAGDVMVGVTDGGTLLVQGDAESNGVVLTSGDQPGEFVLAGRPSADGEPTTINGTFDRVVVSGVSNGIRVRMGEGDDGVNIFNANVRGAVNVATGIGDDTVNIGGPVDDSEGMNTLIRGGLNIVTGDGSDSVRIGRTGIARGLNVATGAGDDYLAVGESRLRGVSHLWTDGGDDVVNVFGTQARFVRLGVGAGADMVNLQNSVFTAIGVNAGMGDDEVSLNRVRARGAWFNGGEGQDSLQFDGPNRFGTLGVNGFESVSGGEEVVADDRLDSVFAEIGSAEQIAF